MKKFPMHRAQASRHQAAFTKAGPWHSSAILCRTCKKAELGIVKRSKANELLLVLPLLIHRIDHKQMSLEFPPHKRGSRGPRRANDISQARFSESNRYMQLLLRPFHLVGSSPKSSLRKPYADGAADERADDADPEPIPGPRNRYMPPPAAGRH